jgi:hypothetical protein
MIDTFKNENYKIVFPFENNETNENNKINNKDENNILRN